jgi:hypothetical protein
LTDDEVEGLDLVCGEVGDVAGTSRRARMPPCTPGGA